MEEKKRFIIGICAMDTKARSKPMRNILDRILSYGDFEAIIFGDKVILDEPISAWPHCDFLISFYSTGFPLEKAIEYWKLYRPYCLNDLPMQQLLLDRRLVLAMLDAVGVPTPKRLVTWNKDLPNLPPLVKQKANQLGIHTTLLASKKRSAKMVNSEVIQVGSEQLSKPFVEKPVSGEDHNIYIYYDEQSGGGVRKLFRKKGNKSSEYSKETSAIRQDCSYIYEEFMSVDNAEDVKVYTIGQSFAHAETRKSPVVDGIVRRNAEGKEIRFVTLLSEEEQVIAKKVCQVFGQTICGFDLLRTNGKSFVIDVNGWSFVKGNEEYYDKSAQMIREIFLKEQSKSIMKPIQDQTTQWRLKAFMSVMRHADRTPKQKVKYTFESDTFLNLVKGSEDEIVYKKEAEFQLVLLSIVKAMNENMEDHSKLEQIKNILEAKGTLSGTKVQLRPIFNKTTGILLKVQLIIKWGGLFTHGGLCHSIDLGRNLRTDLNIINKELLQDIQCFSSSEKRVIDTAESFCKAFLDTNQLDKNLILITKEMLDDSNAAKEQTDFVKSKLQKVLNPQIHLKPPMEFKMPQGWTDLSQPVQELVNLMIRMRTLMRENLKQPPNTTWCCFENANLFKERWEKLFRDFCDVERHNFEPSKISELYDALKFDLLHNRNYLYFSFHTANSGDNENNNVSNNLTAELCKRSKDLFDIIGPHEYGIEDTEKLEIGLTNAQYLINDLLEQLLHAKECQNSLSRLYFTKESKVYSLLNVVLLCGLRTNYKPTDIAELDYLSQITFELYQRNSEHSLRIGFSPGIYDSLGAHDANLIELDLDERHSLSVQPRIWLTDHIPLDEAVKCLMNNDIIKISKQ